MSSLDHSRQREFAVDIVRRLRDAGFEAVWAGGCVRDQLLGHTPKDYDVATSARPKEIRRLFGRRRTLSIGAAFGVIAVLGPPGAGQVEVATFRCDATYGDGRHPDSVSFTDAEHDAQRRDFTINGLFYDPVEARVIDYVGGRQDLSDGVIRAIGNPKARFAEDKLRLLRAVRLAGTFQFQIEAATMQAIQAGAAEVTTVSAERIGMEIRRMLLDPNRTRAVELLKRSELLHCVLPEVDALGEEKLRETLRVLGALETPSLPVSLAALFHLAGSPGNAATVCRRLRYTKKEAERTVWLLTHVELVREAPQVPWPRLQRTLVHEGAEQLIQLLVAVTGQDDASVRFCRNRLAQPREILDPPPLVDGGDLIATGLEPGPQFSEILEAVRDAQLEGRITSRKEALELARELGR